MFVFFCVLLGIPWDFCHHFSTTSWENVFANFFLDSSSIQLTQIEVGGICYRRHLINDILMPGVLEVRQVALDVYLEDSPQHIDPVVSDYKP